MRTHVQVRLDEDLEDAVRAIAAEEERTFSDVLRRLIRAAVLAHAVQKAERAGAERVLARVLS